MKKKIVLICIFLIAYAINGTAQQHLSGIVTHATTGNRIANVKICIKGDTTVVYTNQLGQYEIDIPSGFNTLLFLADNMQIAEVLIYGEKMDIQMQPLEIDIFDLSLEELLELEVTTASRRSERITDAPANVIVITQEEIEQHGWRDLKDLLRTLPQIDISYNCEGEVGSVVTMRGILGNQKILVLQDGIQLNPITGERFVYANNIPLQFYKQIEILYGPAAALYGADAYAGVINLITKDGKDIQGFDINSGYVSTNAYVANITFGKLIGENTDIIVGGRIYYGEDQKLNKYYKDSIDYGILNDYNENLEPKFPIKNWNFFAKFNYKRFSMGANWQHYYQSNAYTTIPSIYSFTEDYIWGQDLAHAFVNYKIIDSDKFSLDAKLIGGRYEVNPESNFLYFRNGHQNTEVIYEYKYAYSAYIKPMILVNWDLSRIISVSGGVSFAYVKSFPKTKNLTNEKFSKQDGFEDNLGYFVDSDGYVYGSIGLTDSVFGLRNYRNYGSFLQTKVKLHQKVKLTLGCRFDYNTIYSSTLNPRIGLVANPNGKLSIKALFGTAYIQPSNYYRWENWASVIGMHIPNVDIKPEQLRTYELSFNYLIARNLSVKILGFRNEMTNIIRAIIVDADSYNQGHPYYNPLRQLVGEPTNSGFVEVNDNLGSMYSQGLEAGINAIVDKFSLKLSYSYLEGEDSESNFPLEKISAHKVNFNISYLHKFFSLALSARFFSDISASKYNSVYGLNGIKNGEKISGGFVLYSNIIIHITKRISCNVAVDNVLNSKHYGAAPFAESGWIMARAPQPMIQFYGGLSIHL